MNENVIDEIKQELKESFKGWVEEHLPSREGLNPQLSELVLKSFNDKLDGLVEIVYNYGQLQGISVAQPKI